jgi:hypothetical protein
MPASNRSANGVLPSPHKTTRGQLFCSAKSRSQCASELPTSENSSTKIARSALLHRHGEAIARDVRARLKAEGLLAKEDRSVKWLREVELSAAQRSDAVNYRPGQIAKFYRLAPGGFRSGQAWTVERVEDERVIVSRDGREKPLPLQSSVAFQVYESGAMPLADGDRILITKNNPRAGVKNGDIVKVAAIDERSITLEGGKKLDVMEGLHARSGYSVTGPGVPRTSSRCLISISAGKRGGTSKPTFLVGSDLACATRVEGVYGLS